MHNPGARKVGEPSRREGATTPAPGALDRVDEASHDHGKGQEGPKLHALSHGPRDDGHGRRHEDHLEEVVGARGVVRIPAGSQDLCRRVFRTDSHAEARDPSAFRDVAVHEGVAKEEVHDAGDGKERHVLGQNFCRVFRTNESRLEHGKARGHKHDQRAHDEKVKGIN